MKTARRVFSLSVLACALLAAAACNYSRPEPKAEINNETKFSSKEYEVKSSPRITVAKKVRKGGGHYRVGEPYKVKGKWYEPKEDAQYAATGKASWYGPNFHGRLTANGEIYDQYALSAAHPTMPLPSYARVTNVDNDRSVIVRVNDRGPFSDKRIIDLSSRAAEMLGYKRQGVANVKVEYVGKARMDGHDEKFLLASYRAHSSEPETGTSGTMVAMADDIDPAHTGSAIESQIDSFLVAGAIPFPEPRPGRIEPGIPLDMTLVASANASMISAYLEETAYQQRTEAAFTAFQNMANPSQPETPANPATQTVVVLVGTYATGEDAGSAYESAAQIGPTSFRMAFVEGREQFEILLHVGGDVAAPVLDMLHERGYLTAKLLD